MYGRSVRLAVNSKHWNPTQTEWLKASQSVQAEEKQRIGNFIYKRDAKSAMVGRLLMRFGVSKMLGVPYRALKFSRTEKGKPFLTSPVDKITPRCDISFNISHQGDFVVFAAEKERPVGVDIMKVEWQRNTTLSKFFDTLDRQLTEHEWKEVKSRSGDMEQLKTFYRLWCLKESVVKALGTGIGFEVQRLNFHFGQPELNPDAICTGTTVHIDGKPAPEWIFEETLLKNHCVAVAVKVDNQDNDILVPEPFNDLKIEDLLSGCEPLLGSETDREYWEVFSGRQEDPFQR